MSLNTSPTGFVRKDISEHIGTCHGRLTILGRSEHKLASVRCKCQCGNECDVRLSYVLSGNTKSCGCLKSEQYKAHWDRRAAKLPATWCRRIFDDLCNLSTGDSDKVVADRYGMARPMIAAAFRVHAARLIEKFGTDLKSMFGNLQGKTRQAKKNGLLVTEFLYLVKQGRVRRPEQTIHIDGEDAADLLASGSWSDYVAA